MELHKPGKSLDDMLDESDSKRLRGARINEIKQSLQPSDKSDKEKMLAYSSHLNWCLKTFESVARLQKMTADGAGKSAYAHGMANGVIGAMAVILEEQGKPPYIPAPKKYKKSEADFAADVVKDYVLRLEEHIGKMVLMDENGPEGYSDDDNPIFSWIIDLVDIIEKSPVNSDHLEQQRQDLMKNITTRTKPKE